MEAWTPSVSGGSVGKITEKTLLPISLIVVLISLAAWLSDLNSSARANAKALENYQETVLRIDRRLSRIEGRLRIDSRGEQ